MAIGNAIVQTAKFKPLSYQEWAAPLQALNTQHAATEEALWELQDKAAEYEQYLIDHPDSPLTQKYNNYINEIDRLSSQLSSSGISPQTRTDLLNLRRDYSNVVKPIKTGISLYQKAAAKRNKDYNKGIIGPDITPENFIYNPNYEDRYTTMEDIYKNASKIFKGLSGYSTEPFNRTMEDGSSVMVTPQSYSQEDFYNAFEGKEAPQEIKEAVNLLREQYSSYAQNDEDLATTIEQSLRLAAQSAVKDPKYSGRHYPPAPKTPKAEKPKPTEDEKIRNNQGKNLTNTSWMTTSPAKNSKGQITHSLSAIPKGAKTETISLEEAQQYTKQLDLLRKHHSEFNKNPHLFDIVKYTVTNAKGKSMVKLAVRLKEQYHYKEQVGATEQPIQSVAQAAMNYRTGNNQGTSLDID